MRNPVIPAEEEVAVKKVIEALEELKKVHFRTKPNASEAGSSDVLMLHSLVYLDNVHKLVEAGTLLKNSLEMTEEDFVETVNATGCPVELINISFLLFLIHPGIQILNDDIHKLESLTIIKLSI